MKNKILIVDDDHRNIKILEEILEDDYTLDNCLSGEETIEYLRTNNPDLVLLDIMMPGIDGYEVAQHIRKQEHLQHTKIILVSGRAMTEDRIKGYESGVHDFVTKPFDHDELEAKVKTFIALYNAQKDLTDLNHRLEGEIQKKTNSWIQNEKMALIGQHAAEIVHNLNSPLTVLLTTIDCLESDQAIPKKALDRLDRSGNKIKNIVSSILESARNSSKETKQSVNINDLITTEVEMAKFNDKNKDFKVNLFLKDIPSLEAIPSHLSQIINNLVQNAVDAMFDSSVKELNISTDLVNNNIEIRIQDTGSGIPDEIKEKIFNPMFTTKSTSKNSPTPQGTGLGLASVKRMVESYSGKVILESLENEGTTFILTFPIYETNPVLKAS